MHFKRTRVSRVSVVWLVFRWLPCVSRVSLVWLVFRWLPCVARVSLRVAGGLCVAAVEWCVTAFSCSCAVMRLRFCKGALRAAPVACGCVAFSGHLLS
jgi:uncharacterized BrkB/YihY/UPF0761 family membrane protein